MYLGWHAAFGNQAVTRPPQWEIIQSLDRHMQNVTLVRVLLMPLQCRYRESWQQLCVAEAQLNLRNVYRSLCVDHSRLPEGCVVQARERPRCHSAPYGTSANKVRQL